MLSTPAIADQAIEGDISFPRQWTVFAPLERDDPILSSEVLRTVPDRIEVGEQTLEARTVTAVNGQYNFTPSLGEPPNAKGRVAYAFVPIESESAQTVTLGMGADHWLQAWVNGREVLNRTAEDKGDTNFPPAIDNFLVPVELREGRNVLAVRFISGTSSSVLALGGPRELRRGNFKSILNDPFLKGDERWTRDDLRASTGDKSPADIGSRLELFIDDFLVDGLAGAAVRRLHHPVPREIVHTLDAPWEGQTSAYLSVVEDGDRILLYYNATPPRPDGRFRQLTAVLESRDGIHFERPNVGLVEYNGSTDNNLLHYHGGHNFAPFKDTNPEASDDARFKATAHPGFSPYASADGIHWRRLREGSAISKGPFDSQNIAFWDPIREIYVGYIRAKPEERSGVRDIRRTTSKDFIEWTEPELIEYTDDRHEHLYTNGIRPYFRAPHIYIGTPNRYVPRRKKVEDHPQGGVSDAVLMSSRDGETFDRWEEGFIRPGADWQVWTDRNNYPAWGMVQTSPEEISLYWTEHYRHEGMRFRRGTIRTDGFVSLHAGGEGVGEMLTRPLIFTGNKLVVNYASSVVGTLRFELCDENGEPIEGFSLSDSDILFGNEIAHTVTWNGKSDLSELAGRPVRLRVRLHDADLYSIRFAE